MKNFAKTDLFVPISHNNLLKQLKFMMSLLYLLTRMDSIASEGYRAVKQIVKENKQKLANIASRGKATWAKITYFADSLFQNFVRRLYRYISKRREDIY